jgi:hypothetical protein
LETLPIKPGYWRTSNESKQVIACSHTIYCQGNDRAHAPAPSGRRRAQAAANATSAPQQSADLCIAYHSGVLCESCEAGYVKRGVRARAPASAG